MGFRPMRAVPCPYGRRPRSTDKEASSCTSTGLLGSTDPAGDRPEYVETVVIGGGQAGLAVGHELQAARPRLRDPRRAPARRRRVAQPLGLAPPVHAGPLLRPCRGCASRPAAATFPTKDEMADYLEAYAAALRSAGPHEHARRRPVAARRPLRGDRGEPDLRGRQRRGRDGELPAAQGARRSPRSSIRASCSCTRSTTGTRRSSRDGPVLVVGVGNSGAEIAMDVVEGATRPGSPGTGVGHIPFRIETFFAAQRPAFEACGSSATMC